MPTTFRDIATDAAQEIGVLGQNETLGAADAMAILKKIRRLLNNWNADRAAVYAQAFPEFTLVPNLSPHTIGPTGVWVTTIRPVTLDGANLILTGTPNNINQPIKVWDAQWWLDNTIPSITTTYPTDVYYQADWPDGKLFFWPVPTAAYDVQLMIRVVLDDTVDLDTTFSLPPGYQDAITLTTAEDIINMFGVGVPPMLPSKALQARVRIFDNNDTPLRLMTADAGMQEDGQRRGTWNFWTGQVMGPRY